jgi:hypothetical protein
MSGYIPQDLFNRYAIFIVMCHLNKNSTTRDSMAKKFEIYQHYYEKDKDLYKDLDTASDKVFESLKSLYPNPDIHIHLLRQLYFLNDEFYLNGKRRETRLIGGELTPGEREYNHGRVDDTAQEIFEYLNGIQSGLFPVIKTIDCSSCGNANSDRRKECFVCDKPLPRKKLNSPNKPHDNSASERVKRPLKNTADKVVKCCICARSRNSVIRHLTDGRSVHQECIDKAVSNRNRLVEEQQNFEIRLREIKPTFGNIFNLFSSKKSNDAQKILRNSIYQLDESIAKLEIVICKVFDHWPEYPPDWEDRSRSAIEDSGHSCNRCQRSYPLQSHHRKPLSSGGSHRSENLEVLCKECHLHAHGTFQFKEGAVPTTERHFSNKPTRYEKRMETIYEAIKLGKDVRFTYRKSDKTETERQVSPDRIDFPDGEYKQSIPSPCLYGYCHLRNKNQTFNIGRMLNLKIVKS